MIVSKVPTYFVRFADEVTYQFDPVLQLEEIVLADPMCYVDVPFQGNEIYITSEPGPR